MKVNSTEGGEEKKSLKLHYWGKLTEGMEQSGVAGLVEALEEIALLALRTSVSSNPKPYSDLPQKVLDISHAALSSFKEGNGQRPVIVCLCGSTRFGAAFQDANLKETLAGKIVLSIGCNMKSDTEIFGHLPESELDNIKEKLDELHKRKIDLADEILVLNVRGYIGNSTRSEIEYAEKLGKNIRWLEPQIGVHY